MGLFKIHPLHRAANAGAFVLAVDSARARIPAGRCRAFLQTVLSYLLKLHHA
jgi:hypothetical protein